jgi:hypothetical protein
VVLVVLLVLVLVVVVVVVVVVMVVVVVIVVVVELMVVVVVVVMVVVLVAVAAAVVKKEWGGESEGLLADWAHLLVVPSAPLVAATVGDLYSRLGREGRGHVSVVRRAARPTSGGGRARPGACAGEHGRRRPNVA